MEVRIENVSRRFDDVRVLSNVSTVIPRRRKVALVGPNGSGKSTLTRILMGMINYEGAVLLDGRSPFKNRVEIAKRLAYVPQSPPQLAVSVSELVKIVAQLRGQPEGEFISSAARLQLDVVKIAERPLKSLSAGMKQKLLIALAFAARPELMILDEPTASLDPAARALFYEYFHEVSRDATLILCSHRVEEIQHLVDHVIVLDSGSVAFDGPMPRFLEGRTSALIEVTLADTLPSAMLSELGFLHTGPELWSKVVTSDAKFTTARTLFQRLDGQLVNMNIRDMEVVSLHPSKEVS